MIKIVTGRSSNQSSKRKRKIAVDAANCLIGQATWWPDKTDKLVFNAAKQRKKKQARDGPAAARSWPWPSSALWSSSRPHRLRRSRRLGGPPLRCTSNSPTLAPPRWSPPRSLLPTRPWRSGWVSRLCLLTRSGEAALMASVGDCVCAGRRSVRAAGDARAGPHRQGLQRPDAHQAGLQDSTHLLYSFINLSFSFDWSSDTAAQLSEQSLWMNVQTSECFFPVTFLNFCSFLL